VIVPATVYWRGSCLRCALLLALVLCSTACARPGDRGVPERVAAAVERGDGTIVDFRQIAPFGWTRMFVFGPYTTQAIAERRLGFRWPFHWSSIESADDRAFVVFVDSGKIVATMDQLLLHGAFADSVGHQQGYPPDSARFRVIAHGTLSDGKPYRELRWTP
jgi:hypothetical protein